jgi:NAD-dependent deacetylase
MSPIPPQLIDQLRHAQRVVVMSGAGVSAESGVPTFRDAQKGLWAKYDPTELASPEAFRRNPALVWQWYRSRFNGLKNIQPNPGHYALAQLAERVPHFTLITQNVDGLHQAAGSKGVLALHGDIRRTKCFAHNHPFGGWPPEPVDDGMPDTPPPCPQCGSPLRPDVVWFGESLPAETLQAAAEAAQRADVYFTIGTSSMVYPAAGLTTAVLEAGAVVVEINPNPTPLTPYVTYALSGASGEILPALLAEL